MLEREAAMLVLRQAALRCQKMADYEEPGYSCCQNFLQLQDWIAQAFSAKLSLSGWLHGKCSGIALRCAACGTARCAASSLRGPFAVQYFLSGDNSGFTRSVVDPIRDHFLEVKNYATSSATSRVLFFPFLPFSSSSLSRGRALGYSSFRLSQALCPPVCTLEECLVVWFSSRQTLLEFGRARFEFWTKVSLLGPS